MSIGTIEDERRDPVDLPTGRRRRRRVFEVVERHPVLSVFCLALAVRLILAVVISVVLGPGVFSDDVTYSQLAAERASGNTARWDDYNYWLYDATASFLVPLTALYSVVGHEPVAGRVFVAVLGSIAAAATARLTLEALPARWALVAGAGVALLPSQVLFSSVILKDAAVWAVLTVLAVLTAVLGRSSGWRLPALLGGAAVMLVLLTHLRLHTLVVAAWAFAIASVFGVRSGRVPRIVGALALLMVVPLWAGAGVAGFDLVRDQQGTLERTRVANAQGAETAFVPLPPPERASQPEKQVVVAEPATTQTPTAPSKDPAPVLEDDMPVPSSAGDFSRLSRGLQAVVLDPLPWQAATNSRVALARAESTLAWWPLLALAAVGALRLRRHLRVLAFPVLAGAAIALMYSLAEGNFGTAYRHRGEFVWVVCVLAALGLHSMWGWLSARRSSGSAG